MNWNHELLLSVLWILKAYAITVVLAGARNAEQVMANAKAMDIRLSPEEMNAINSALVNPVAIY